MANTANVFPDGPIHCQGAIVIGDEQHSEVYLCRCGASANKPFCDGAHNGSGFSEPATFADAGEAGGDEPVKLTLFPNGPIGIRGPLSVSGAEGTAHVTRGALCRCGQTAKPPFCDGAHRACGFTAP